MGKPSRSEDRPPSDLLGSCAGRILPLHPDSTDVRAGGFVDERAHTQFIGGADRDLTDDLLNAI
ncbi:MAG: hypothetical protein ACE5GX_18610, partial [Thermoanaerobaculia bacterium]